MSLNPLFWLHLRIGGSTRTNLIVVIAYATLVIIFTGGSYYIAAAEAGANVGPQTYARVDGVWLIIMTVAQCVFLLLLAPSAIRRAVQRDFDSGMIESHRLSPMSNLKIVLGYMTGAPIQAVMLYAVSLLFGSYFATRYALSPGLGGTLGLRATLAGWYFAQGCMLVVAAMAGAFVLLTALATRGKGNIIGIAILIGVFGGWAAIFVIPGLALLAGVLSGSVLIGLLTSARVGGDPSIIVVSALLQAVFCVIMLAAACGKLRSPNRAVFSVELGLILLIVWGVTLAAGIFIAPAHGWLFSEWERQALAQLVASTVAFVLVALLPLIGATVELCQRDRAAAFGEDRSARRCAELTFVPLMLGLMTATCCLIMSPIWAAAELLGHLGPNALIRQIFVPIAVAMLCGFWIDFNWVYHLAAHGRRVMIGLPIMFVFLKGVPLLLDGAIKYFGRELAGVEWSGHGYLTGLSPVGTLMLVSKGGAPLWVGLVFQAALAVASTMLTRRARRRLGRRADEAPVPHDMPAAAPGS